MGSRLNIGAVFRETAAIYRTESSRLLPVALAAVSVPAGVAALTATYLSDAPASLINTAVINSATVLFAGIAKETVRRRRADEPRASLGELLGAVRPVFLRLIAVAGLTGLGVAAGFVLLVIPGLVLLTWWAVAAPALAVEHTGVLEAFRRSRALVRGNARRVFGVLAIILLAEAALTGISEGIFALLGLGHDLDIQVVIGEALALPVEGLAVPLMYFALVAIERARVPAD